MNHTRNLPDDILESISEKGGRIDSFVWVYCTAFSSLDVAHYLHLDCRGVPFLPDFINDVDPTVDDIANHVEHIASVAGKSRVGIGSDFDGFRPPAIPGMEDVSHYRNLVSVQTQEHHHQFLAHQCPSSSSKSWPVVGGLRLN